MNENIRLHAIISGRVQGVGFRAFTQRNAVILDLTGWVRNRWDGTVEVVAEGPRSRLEKLLHHLQRGPFPGTSSQVRHDWLSATSAFTAFKIKRTG
jgi:acylphosphatase